MARHFSLAVHLVMCNILKLILTVQAENDCILMILPQAYRMEHNSALYPNINSFTLISTGSQSEYGYATYEAIEDYITYSNRIGQPCRKKEIETNCNEIVGVVGAIDSETASILHTLASRFNLNLTIVAAGTPSTSLPVTNLALPNILDMNPLSHYIEATVSFIDHWNWTRIGIVSDDSNYYQFAAEILQKRLAENPAIIATPVVTMQKFTDPLKTVKQILEYGTHVIVVAMERALMCSLLEAAFQLDMRWPKFAWILLPVRIPATQLSCLIDYEGTFTMNDLYFGIDMTINATHNAISELCSGLTQILDDSAMAVSFLVGSDTTFTGKLGELEFREGKHLTNISISQVEHNTTLAVARYDSKQQQLFVVNDLLPGSERLNGSTEIKQLEISPVRTVGVLSVFFLCLLFVTLMLILYIYFRNEPEVKATSVPVSICMFFSCYLLLLFVPSLIFPPLFHRDTTLTCNIQLWLSASAIPVLLILATLLIKMMRVYVIFLKPHSYKRKLLSSPLLLLYIVLIMLPSILILLLWTATDTFSATRYETVEKDHLLVVIRCRSNYPSIWLSLLLVYIMLLVVVLVVIAFKSSNIRYKNFRDTKATNAFTFLTIYTIIQVEIYWYFYRSLGNSLYSILNTQIVLFFCHFSLPLLCQIYLFVPKIIPPLKQRFTRNHLIK